MRKICKQMKEKICKEMRMKKWIKLIKMKTEIMKIKSN
jgi:hypothetical protein